MYCTVLVSNERQSLRLELSCATRNRDGPVGFLWALTPCWILSFARPSTLRLFYGPHLCMAHGFNIFVYTPTLGVLPKICQAKR
jgi:hypothetical protein